MNAGVAAGISAVTSVVVVLVSLWGAGRQQRGRDERAEREALNSRYLNPLRLHLVENHFRMASTLQRVEAGAGRYEPLLVVDEPAEVSEKDTAWFTGTGVGLVSSAYLTACLFAQLKKVREDIPYLRLSGADDTELAALLQRVQLGFLQDDGVYYAMQPSIGEDMRVRGEDRLRTYREFCVLLRDPDTRVWLDGLLRFHLETGRGQKPDRVRAAIAAIRELSDFLDERVGGGESIQSRWGAEGIPLDG